MSPMRVVALPVFTDNYVFVLIAGDRAVLIDPGDAEAPLEYLERQKLEPEAILLTHHHTDHVGGVRTIVRRYAGIRVAGARGDSKRLPPLTDAVSEGDTITLAVGTARVIEVPGHTRGHIAWFFPEGRDGGDLFSGDTVFGGTIGNLFEGTPDDMYGSLVKLRALPPATRVWCAHEYTLQYVREAARFDPENARLAAQLARLEAAPPGSIHVPLMLEEERAANPFFRWDDPALTARLGTAPGVETFRRLCELL